MTHSQPVYLAHASGFGIDEACLVVIPIAVIIALIMIIGMRSRAISAAPENEANDPNPSRAAESESGKTGSVDVPAPLEAARRRPSP